MFGKQCCPVSPGIYTGVDPQSFTLEQATIGLTVSLEIPRNHLVWMEATNWFDMFVLSVDVAKLFFFSHSNQMILFRFTAFLRLAKQTVFLQSFLIYDKEHQPSGSQGYFMPIKRKSGIAETADVCKRTMRPKLMILWKPASLNFRLWRRTINLPVVKPFRLTFLTKEGCASPSL